MRTFHAARARHGTREGAYAPLASPDYEVFEAAEEDESVIGRIVAAQREEVEREIAGLEVGSERIAEEVRELAGEVPF